MKSNQERSNECLPPKKREILALEEKQVLVSAAASERQSGENLAWLASVATMASMAHIPNNAGLSQNSTEPDSPPPSNKALTVVTEYPPATTSGGFSFSSSSSTYRGVFSGPTVLTANSTVLSTSLPQNIGSVQYTQLPPNLQLIGPYTSYISSQIVPSTNSPTQPRKTPQEVLATYAGISQASSIDSQNQHMISSVQNVSHSQCIQVERAPLGLTVCSATAAQLPLQIHPHSTVLAPHGLALTHSPVVLHYTDGIIARQLDSHTREVHNGALGEVTIVKHSTTMAKGVSNQTEGDQNHKPIQSLGLQTQARVLFPADYATHDRAELQTSLMLISSSHLAAKSNPELQKILGKDHSSLNLAERGGICLGKPKSRVSARTSSDSQVSPASTLSHTLLQAPHNTHQQELSTSLYSATQLPIIGYITSAPSGPQQAMAGYPSNLPHHVVISGSPSLLIPVSATNINPSTAEPEATRCSVIPSAANTSAALPQTFINTVPPAATASVLPNGKEITGSDGVHAPCTMQSPSQVQLPVMSASVVGSPVPLTPPTSTSPHSSPSPSASLPPFFMKGSIIQLADGELKRVEDLRTEDFVQSAEVSGELKLDSSTVERIECSHSPNAVIIQFSVGENKAQVCVEVLVEYPFFVFGQGWSSCCPDRTTQLLALSCAKLSVGDVCISLTLKCLKNSSQKKDYFSNSVLKHNNPHLKGVKRNGSTEERPAQMEDFNRGRKITTGEENNVAGTLVENLNPGNILILLENGGVNPQKTYISGAERAVSRKRRWSAPERGETGRSQEDPQILPKFSFLPYQLKVSIEGRSSTGY